MDRPSKIGHEVFCPSYVPKAAILARLGKILGVWLVKCPRVVNLEAFDNYNTTHATYRISHVVSNQ